VVPGEPLVVGAVEGVKVLVTGAGGQVGSELVRVCAQAGDDVVAADRARLDVGDRDAVLGAVLSARPDVVVHCGAWTAVDDCEGDPDRAWRDNALACRWVAEACRRSGAHLVHVSTDYVFSGDKLDPYVEWDAPGPRSAYGRSKLAGEEEIRAGLPGAAIARTSWVCGAGGRNVVRTVLELLAKDPSRELAFVDDQRGCPSFTDDLAPALRRLAASRLPGTFHVTNSGPTTWFGFVEAVLEAAGRDPGHVRPIATADLDPPRPAPRPSNSVLDGAAWRLSGFDALPHWSEPLERLVKELQR
jgi:dTDP-4-dehydrorhamnose reductase